MHKIWLTSDQHFGHRNVITYCSRPFKDVDHMKEELVSRFNAKVSHDDMTWHLGDFSMHPRELDVLRRLNGWHALVVGNHDGCHPVQCKSDEKLKRLTQVYLDAGFAEVSTEDKLVMTDHPFETIKLHHMPYSGDHGEKERFTQYRPQDDGLWLLHGHVHTEWKVRGKQINIGVDQWGYAPVALDTIKEIVRNKENKNDGHADK